MKKPICFDSDDPLTRPTNLKGTACEQQSPDYLLQQEIFIEDLIDTATMRDCHDTGTQIWGTHCVVKKTNDQSSQLDWPIYDIDKY